MSSKNQPLVAVVEEKPKNFTFDQYFKKLWAYQDGKLEDHELLSYGRVGLHIWQSLNNPDGFIYRDGEKTDKKIAHPVFALSEQEHITLTGHGELTGDVSTARNATIKMDSMAERIDALQRVIDNWPQGNANAGNTWKRYYIVAHAYTFNAVGKGFFLTALRNYVGLGSEEKWNFIVSRVLGMSAEAIRVEWHAKVKAEAEAKKEVEAEAINA